MNRLATGAIAVALIGTPALAADMGVPSRSYYPPLPPAIYDWTGIYVGGHIGGGMLTDSVSQNGVSPGGFNLANSGSLRPAGVIGGGQIGAELHDCGANQTIDQSKLYGSFVRAARDLGAPAGSPLALRAVLGALGIREELRPAPPTDALGVAL